MSKENKYLDPKWIKELLINIKELKHDRGGRRHKPGHQSHTHDNAGMTDGSGKRRRRHRR